MERLRNPDKIRTGDLGTFKITYKTLLPRRVDELILKNTERGVVNSFNFAMDVLGASVEDWFEVVDENGDEVPYTPDMWEYMDEKKITQALNIVRGDDALKEEMGNSSGSSNSDS